MRRFLTVLGASAASALFVLGFAPAAAAHADDDDQAEGTNPLQDQVDRILEAHPGGTQIAENQIAWDGGDVVLTIPSEDVSGLAAVGSCATGRFCAYSGSNQGGLQLSFSSCTGTNSTAPIGAVRSVTNARSSGTVSAFNGSSVVLTVGAGSTANTSATITRLGC